MDAGRQSECRRSGVGLENEVGDQRAKVVRPRRSALLPLAWQPVRCHEALDPCRQPRLVGCAERDEVHRSGDTAGQRWRPEPYVLQVDESVANRESRLEPLAHAPCGQTIGQPQLDQLRPTLDPGRERRAE